MLGCMYAYEVSKLRTVGFSQKISLKLRYGWKTGFLLKKQSCQVFMLVSGRVFESKPIFRNQNALFFVVAVSCPTSSFHHNEKKRPLKEMPAKMDVEAG